MYKIIPQIFPAPLMSVILIKNFSGPLIVCDVLDFLGLEDYYFDK